MKQRPPRSPSLAWCVTATECPTSRGGALDSRFLATLILPSLALGCGGSGAVAADASTRPTVDASLDAASESAVSVHDAGSDGDSSSEAGDAGPAIQCEAGDYFVTVNDGTATKVLRGGCGDSGPSVPWVQERGIGDTCDAPFVYGCSASEELAFYLGGCNGPSLAVETGPAHVTYDDGTGQTRGGIGIAAFSAVGPVGGTAAGSFSAKLSNVDSGADGGSISGTFCVLYVAGH